MILAIATFVFSKHIIKKKHDKQVERFLEIEGPFDLEMCLAVIKEVVPDLAADLGAAAGSNTSSLM